MSDTTDPIERDELGERRLFEELLAGQVPSSEDPQAEQLAAVLGALTAPATSAELTGEEAALAAFRESVVARPTRTHRLRKTTMLTSLLSAKALLAAGVAVAAVGGTTAAAYVGVLPDGLQNAAHDVIGAPPAHSHAGGNASAGADVSAQAGSQASATPVGPDVSTTSPALFGLCTAWDSGAGANMSPNSTVFKNLYAASGDSSATNVQGMRDAITTYCDGVLPSAKPTDHPSQGTNPGQGQASDHPSGPPSSTPAHATGMPSELPSAASVGASAAASAQANH